MKSDKNKLILNALENISKRNKSIAIVGLGYVGLPLALTFAENDFSVIGIDIDQQKIEKLKNRESYLKHISNSRISRTIETKKLIPTLDFSNAEQCMDDRWEHCQQQPNINWILLCKKNTGNRKY